MQEPVRTVDVSGYCNTRAPHMKHGFALSTDGGALVTTSVTSQIPVLMEGEENGQWEILHAGSHRGHVTAVDWHPHMNVIVSGSADHCARVIHLDV